jgi:hypothetical protein
MRIDEYVLFGKQIKQITNNNDDNKDNNNRERKGKI